MINSAKKSFSELPNVVKHLFLLKVKLDLSTKEISGESGISRAAIDSWFNGSREPTKRSKERTQEYLDKKQIGKAEPEKKEKTLVDRIAEMIMTSQAFENMIKKEVRKLFQS